MRQGRELVIDADSGAGQYWRDLWDYRELFGILAWRDILVRYKQTVLGVAWAVIQPLFAMLALTLVFGRIAKLPADGVPYHVLVFCGLLPWQLFSQALSGASNSLVAQGNIITKVYFPRLIVPTSSAVTSVIDFLVALVLLAGIMMWEGVAPTWRITALPLFLVMTFAAAMGLGLWFAALTLKYRDFRFLVPFVLQIGLYVSPVGFSGTIVPEKWRLLYSLNPMVPIIEGFRWSLLPGDRPLNWTSVGIGAAIVGLFMVIGTRYFLATERDFADVV